MSDSQRPGISDPFAILSHNIIQTNCKRFDEHWPTLQQAVVELLPNGASDFPTLHKGVFSLSAKMSSNIDKEQKLRQLIDVYRLISHFSLAATKDWVTDIGANFTKLHTLKKLMTFLEIFFEALSPKLLEAAEFKPHKSFQFDSRYDAHQLNKTRLLIQLELYEGCLTYADENIDKQSQSLYEEMKLSIASMGTLESLPKTWREGMHPSLAILQRSAKQSVIAAIKGRDKQNEAQVEICKLQSAAMMDSFKDHFAQNLQTNLKTPWGFLKSIFFRGLKNKIISTDKALSKLSSTNLDFVELNDALKKLLDSLEVCESGTFSFLLKTEKAKLEAVVMSIFERLCATEELTAEWLITLATHLPLVALRSPEFVSKASKVLENSFASLSDTGRLMVIYYYLQGAKKQPEFIRPMNQLLQTNMNLLTLNKLFITDIRGHKYNFEKIVKAYNKIVAPYGIGFMGSIFNGHPEREKYYIDLKKAKAAKQSKPKSALPPTSPVKDVALPPEKESKQEVAENNQQLESVNRLREFLQTENSFCANMAELGSMSKELKQLHENLPEQEKQSEEAEKILQLSVYLDNCAEHLSKNLLSAIDAEKLSADNYDDAVTKLEELVSGVPFQSRLKALNNIVSAFQNNNTIKTVCNDVLNTDKYSKLRNCIDKFKQARSKSNKLALDDYMIQPAQRLARYPLLLSEMIGNRKKDIIKIKVPASLDGLERMLNGRASDNKLSLHRNELKNLRKDKEERAIKEFFPEALSRVHEIFKLFAKQYNDSSVKADHINDEGRLYNIKTFGSSYVFTLSPYQKKPTASSTQTNEHEITHKNNLPQQPIDRTKRTNANTWKVQPMARPSSAKVGAKPPSNKVKRTSPQKEARSTVASHVCSKHPSKSPKKQAQSPSGTDTGKRVVPTTLFANPNKKRCSQEINKLRSSVGSPVGSPPQIR